MEPIPNPQSRRVEAKPTLSFLELDHGEEAVFVLADGTEVPLKLTGTRAFLAETNLPEPLKPIRGGRTVYRMTAYLDVAGHPLHLVREVGSQKSFYEPYEFFGIRLWFDAVDDMFGTIVTENHGQCRPRKKARFAIQDASLRICPPLLHPWCPLPEDGLRIADCYCGDDCWMGAYQGADAHGGLDINHPAGAPLWTPFAIDDHFFFNHLSRDDNNNRWRGTKTWPDGSVWVIESRHLIRLHVPEHTPIEAGIHYADSAGVLSGAHEHTHFDFGIMDPATDQMVELDPWILFRQMYLDRRQATAKRTPYL